MEFEKESMKILIVDDNEIDLELLKATLKNLGFQNIITSESGKEAIRLAEEHQPDLFFIDINMPGMTGGEFRGLLKQNPVTKDIPVIFISGMISKEEEKELGGRFASGDFIIAKPFSREKIAQVILAMLGKAPGSQ
jgi:two-component system OmpR family response regulator